MICCCVSYTRTQFFGAFQIVAILPDTCVDIFEADEYGEYSHKISEYFEIGFQTLLYTSAYKTDITGYKIVGSRPVSVFAGHACASIPEGKSYCDHIVEQIPPVSELGKLHFVPPIIGRYADAGFVFTCAHA